MYGKIIRELPEKYSVAKIYYNRKRRIIDGKSSEATTIRDRHFDLKDFVNSLSGDLEENLRRISDFTGVSFEKWIGRSQKDTTKAVTLRDYIAKYLELKGDTISDKYREQFTIASRNLSMFIKLHPVGDDNLKNKDEDQQKIFFSKYVTFLAKDTVDDEQLGFKGPYENASIKEEFSRLASVCKEFKKVGLEVSLTSFISNLKVPKSSSEQPHVSYDEIMVILKNLDKIDNSMEEKAVYVSLFQYFTGLRHNELYQIEDRNITIKMVDGIQIKVLNYVSDKTDGKPNAVPLNNVCLRVLDYWRNKKFRPPKRKGKIYHDCILPVLTLVGTLGGFRSFLKKLPEFCVDVKRIRYRGSEKIEQVMPRWQRLGTHAFRHGYSAYLTDRGVSIDNVGQLMNHEPGSHTTKKRYQHLKEDKVILEAFRALEKAG